MDSSSVISGLMQDLSGRAHMDSEDPKWGALFLAVEYYADDMQQREAVMAAHWARLITNCRKSNNLHKLLEQTANRLHHMMSLKHSPANALPKQCCGALYLSASVMSYLFSHYGPDEV